MALTHTIRTTNQPAIERVVSHDEYEYLLELGLIYDGTPPVEPADAFDLRVAERLADTDSATRIAIDGLVLDAVVPSASTTVKGIVELATTAETTTGTDTVRAVTPAGVAAAVSAGVASAVATVGALIVIHGTNAATARPSTTGPVVWIGTGEPDNADDTKDVFVPVTTGS